ncbi:hypothetical protein KBZ13_05585 [Cyanobium sp. ATX 6F1]|nr:hypothetical protein [Cyanobium sp. ATX 6F1]
MLLAALLALLLELAFATPAFALAPERYLCDGDPLQAQVENGAVDALNLPNTAAGTVPGAVVLLRWREQVLQLPRTNNAGAPSYSDGQWWWSVEDPEHPRFLQSRGVISSFACQRQDSGA